MQSNILDIQTEKIQGFRLSPQQKRTWLLQDTIENSPYQVKGSVRIEGLLDREKLKQAWQKIVEKHEILRTSFSCLDGMLLPLQVINDHLEPIWQDVDLSQLEIEEQNDYLENFFQALDNKISLSLGTISEQKHILLLTLPALYGDVLSFKKIVNEISHYYHDLNSNSDLDNEPMQYADFAEWQNELLEDKATEIGSNYWHY